MNCTSEPLRIKSENLIGGITMMIEELKKTNDEILVQQQINDANIEQQNQNIDHIRQDNEELAAIREENIRFIENVEKLIASRTEPTT